MSFSASLAASAGFQLGWLAPTTDATAKSKITKSFRGNFVFISTSVADHVLGEPKAFQILAISRARHRFGAPIRSRPYPDGSHRAVCARPRAANSTCEPGAPRHRRFVLAEGSTGTPASVGEMAAP